MGSMRNSGSGIWAATAGSASRRAAANWWVTSPLLSPCGYTRYTLIRCDSHLFFAWRRARACPRRCATRRSTSITIDGKPFTTFHYGAEANKPFLAPVRSASGKIVTRGFPMENIAGESRDHLHHTGLWFSYDDVNGVKFWENDPSYTKPNIGRIVVRSAEFKDGDPAATLTATMDWRDPDGKVLLVETRNMVFSTENCAPSTSTSPSRPPKT